MNFGDKTIYCKKCKKERWVGAKCPASKKGENCNDMEAVKKL